MSLIPAEQLEVLPQIDGTCWFNSILMVLLYSEGSRRILINEIANWTDEEINGDKFKSFIAYVLKYNYAEPEKIRELFKRRFKTSSLLLSLLRGNSSLKKLKEEFKEKLKNSINDLRYFPEDFLLNKDFFELLFFDRNDYAYIYYDGVNSYSSANYSSRKTKLLIVFHTDFHYENQYEMFPMLINIKDIEKPNENIKINDIIYKLDSCITINYNKNKRTHAIAGITYDDKSYIYNGWTIPKKQDTKIRPYTKAHKYACPLFNVNWKQLLHEKEGYCLSQKDCNIIGIDELNNYCFNFSKKSQLTTLIYIKEEKKPSYIPEIKLKEDIRKIEFKSSSISSLINSFFELEKKSLNELREDLLKIRYISIINLEIFESIFISGNYKILYFMICKKRFEEDLNDLKEINELLRKFYINLLKIYLKNRKKIFKLMKLEDSEIYEYLSIKKIKELLLLAGIENLEDTKNKQLLFKLLLGFINGKRAGGNKIIFFNNKQILNVNKSKSKK